MEFETFIRAADIRRFDCFRMKGEPGWFFVRNHPRVGKQLVEVQLSHTREDGSNRVKNRRLKVDLEVDLVAREGGYFSET